MFMCGSALKASGELLRRYSPTAVTDKSPVVSDARISCVFWAPWSIGVEVRSWRAVSATVLQRHYQQNTDLSFWRTWGLGKRSPWLAGGRQRLGCCWKSGLAQSSVQLPKKGRAQPPFANWDWRLEKHKDSSFRACKLCTQKLQMLAAQQACFYWKIFLRRSIPYWHFIVCRVGTSGTNSLFSSWKAV